MDDAVRRDFAGLVDQATSLAAKLLREQGEFDPFGILINQAGAFERAGGYTGNDRLSGGELRELAIRFMRSRANQGTLKACAVCADATLNGPDGRATDTINVFLEHHDGEARTVLKPYFKGADGGLFFEPLILLTDEPAVFAGSNDPSGKERDPKRRGVFGRFGRG
jgi:hypothetical protein